MKEPEDDRVKHGFAVYRCPGHNVVILPITIGPIRGDAYEHRNPQRRCSRFAPGGMTGPVEAVTEAIGDGI